MVDLPPELLRQAAARSDRIVLVTGAGTSHDAPTDLPLSRTLSLNANAQLVADRILDPGECPTPEDLSALADVVYAKMGNRQFELVNRLPRSDLKGAPPNDGHLATAALLMEHCLSNVLTLNLDLALDHALSVTGNRGQIAIVSGPSQMDQLAGQNLVYLHRNVNADHEDWILRTAALEEEWKDSWEEIIAARIMTAPIVVFVGLGTPAGVLLHTVRKLKAALSAGVIFLQVDPGAFATSTFASALDIDESSYFQMSWIDFMRALSERVLLELRADLSSTCHALAQAEGWSEALIEDLCDRFEQMGLLGQGMLRARWLMSPAGYTNSNPENCGFLADLLLAIGEAESALDLRAELQQDGVVHFFKADRLVGVAMMASGRGIRRWAALEAEIRQAGWVAGARRPAVAVVSGVSPPAQLVPPASITTDRASDDLIAGTIEIKMISVDEIRAEPSRLAELL